MCYRILQLTWYEKYEWKYLKNSAFLKNLLRKLLRCKFNKQLNSSEYPLSPPACTSNKFNNERQLVSHKSSVHSNILFRKYITKMEIFGYFQYLLFCLLHLIHCWTYLYDFVLILNQFTIPVLMKHPIILYTILFDRNWLVQITLSKTEKFEQF